MALKNLRQKDKCKAPTCHRMAINWVPPMRNRAVVLKIVRLVTKL